MFEIGEKVKSENLPNFHGEVLSRSKHSGGMRCSVKLDPSIPLLGNAVIVANEGVFTKIDEEKKSAIEDWKSFVIFLSLLNEELGKLL